VLTAVEPTTSLSPTPALAVVAGEPMLVLPEDLYIPPDALQIILEEFEGPLDLLLYLIKKQNIDIAQLPVAKITHQYVQYIELMRALQLELAAEYLLMAAMLAEIKSRALLPVTRTVEEDDTDPRTELIRRLQEYERYKTAAEDIDQLPRNGRDTFDVLAELPDLKQSIPLPEVELTDLLQALARVLKRAELNAHHHIQREPLSIRQRMSDILDGLRTEKLTTFCKLFRQHEGRMGVVVTFVAILELVKQSLIRVVQTEPFSPIHVTLNQDE
jgi:segregation and condensation protein A